jgi:hypothetical protein
MDCELAKASVTVKARCAPFIGPAVAGYRDYLNETAALCEAGQRDIDLMLNPVTEEPAR